MPIINPRRACAARVTVVGLSVCVCLVLVKKRKEGESCGERGVVTETGGGLVGVIKALDHQTDHSGCAWLLLDLRNQDMRGHSSASVEP